MQVSFKNNLISRSLSFSHMYTMNNIFDVYFDVCKVSRIRISFIIR